MSILHRDAWYCSGREMEVTCSHTSPSGSESPLQVVALKSPHDNLGSPARKEMVHSGRQRRKTVTGA